VRSVAVEDGSSLPVPDRRTDPTVIRDRLSANDADAIDNTQLEIRSAADVYLAHGDFVAAQMIGFLDETAGAVSAVEGGRLFRATGEMSWATGSSRKALAPGTFIPAGRAGTSGS